MSLISTAVFLVLFYVFTKPLISFLLNYRIARNTKLPLLLSPLTPYTWQWQLLATLLRPSLHSFQWFRAIDWTCAWQDGDKLHSSLGPSFILVSPGLNVLCTSDPKSIEHVLRKWRDFVKPDNVNEILGTFGQNVDTSNGDDWTRHRKITAPCFSERASAKVWETAMEQAGEILKKWSARGGSGTESMIGDTSMLALNVISAVAFENHDVSTPAKGHALSLREALVTVMSTAISPAMESAMPWLKMTGLQTLLPKQIKKLLMAMGEFREYMDELVERERKKSNNQAEGRTNLINTLIKANDAAKVEKTGVQARLSDVELRGNIFIFTVGGLESTAITLSYSVALLAAHPDIQRWVNEEVEEVLEDGETEYSKLFPRLKRIMAVMYETLRLYGPSPPLPRAHISPHKSYTVPSSSHTSNSKTDTIQTTLPGSIQIMLNSWACQSSPLYFSDSKIWNPKRWIDTDGKLMHPTSESGFYAWGSGPRICPGMKFSQVEYTAVLASVLRKVRVELAVGDEVVEGGKEWEKEKDTLLSVLKDSCADPLLLHVRRPEALKLKFLPR